MNIKSSILRTPKLTMSAMIKEGRLAAPRRTIRTARPININTATEIAALPSSLNPYRFAIKRRLGGIGDIVMTTVALRGLKEKFPNCHITYVTGRTIYGGQVMQLLSTIPYIDEILALDEFVESKVDYWADVTDIDIRIETSTPNPIERIDIYCSYLGVKPSSRKPIVVVLPEEQESAREFLAKFPEGKYVYLNQASNNPRRNTPARTLESATLQLANAGVNVILSNQNVVNVSHPRVIRYENTVRQLAAMLSVVDAAIVHDSAPLHIGGALGIPMVCIFGCMHPDSRSSHYDPKKIIWNQYSCPKSPCMYAPCHYENKCMTSIHPNQIVQATMDFFNESKR